MTTLKIYQEDGTLLDTVTDHDALATRLDDIGVQFEQWTANEPLDDSAGQEEVLAAYADPVSRLKNQYGFQSADVIALTPDHPDRVALRQKFLDEHTHSDFEVRFFVDGKGLFFIHQQNRVYGVMCEKGDLISVPADTRHWFDMGENPAFKCIRLFTTPEGWVANYTGDTIASHFPRFETY
jgi:1,2-dihydroxy-3-keto-5-methylthiopentene dioxygenase